MLHGIHVHSKDKEGLVLLAIVEYVNDLFLMQLHRYFHSKDKVGLEILTIVKHLSY